MLAVQEEGRSECATCGASDACCNELNRCTSRRSGSHCERRRWSVIVSAMQCTVKGRLCTVLHAVTVTDWQWRCVKHNAPY